MKLYVVIDRYDTILGVCTSIEKANKIANDYIWYLYYHYAKEEWIRKEFVNNMIEYNLGPCTDGYPYDDPTGRVYLEEVDSDKMLWEVHSEGLKPLTRVFC